MKTSFVRSSLAFFFGPALFVSACGGTTTGAESPTSSDAYEDAPTGAASAADTQASPDEPSGAADERTFQTTDSETAGSAHGESESTIKPSAEEAAMKFFVVDKAKNEPIAGIVIAMTSEDGKTYYTEETDGVGYAEVLVPVGKKYELVYLSLGHRDVSAKVDVSDKPNQNIKLTLRYKRRVPKPRAEPKDEGGGGGVSAAPSGFVLEGVQFDTGKATIRPESYERLDSVLEYMTHKKSARIEISGHTDNVGNPASNKSLSKRRAEAVKEYLMEKGIEGKRIEAVGHGDSQPVASNSFPEGRQANRRIEAREL